MLAAGFLALGVMAPHAAMASSPEVDVLGSYFPAWLICMVIGVFLAIIARLLFIAWKIEAHLFPAPIIYSCLTAIFAMTVWLIFFRD